MYEKRLCGTLAADGNVKVKVMAREGWGPDKIR